MMTAQEARELRAAHNKSHVDSEVACRLSQVDDKIRRAISTDVRQFYFDTNHAVVAEVLTGKLVANGFQVDSDVDTGIITLTVRF